MTQELLHDILYWYFWGSVFVLLVVLRFLKNR